jgi:carboxypeptidase T
MKTAAHRHAGRVPRQTTEELRSWWGSPELAETIHDGDQDPDVLDGIARAGPPSYFRTYESLKKELFALRAQYPDLVTIEDVGDSMEKVSGRADRDILAIRLTNRAAQGAHASGKKPIVLWLGGVHAREIANPELLMRWAKKALAEYGTHPEATALLDTREIVIVPMVNPDGHAVVERGYAESRPRLLDQRKNTSGINGTDINRNFDFLWGTAGSSTNPNSSTYRGPHAGSESETQAVMQLARAIRPDLFIDWHSSGELVMRPFAHTNTRAPDETGLLAVSQHMARLSGYDAIRAIQLYPTSGTSRDFMYGALGIPAFTIETGTVFHQSDLQFERTWRETEPVMTFAAGIADAPYARAQGPMVSQLSVGPSVLSGDVTEHTNQKIVAAEATFDPFASPGAGIALNAADGAFDEAQETVTAPVELLGSGDRRLVYVRAKDETGAWGPLKAQWITPAGE